MGDESLETTEGSQEDQLQCHQCEKVALFSRGGFPLCSEHDLIVQQSTYLSALMSISIENDLNADIEMATGIAQPRAYLPPLPSMGGNLTLNNINVQGSTVGVINSGVIHNLDTRITLNRGQGNAELADALQAFTQELHQTQELAQEAANDIAEQLDYLISQVGAEPGSRSMGPIKAVFAGVRDGLAGASTLTGLWNALESAIRGALG